MNICVYFKRKPFLLAIICQLLVSGQGCSIWRDHSFVPSLGVSQKNAKKSSQHITQISVYWRLLLLMSEYRLVLSFSVFRLNYKSIFASRDRLQRSFYCLSFGDFLCSFRAFSLHLISHSVMHTREGGRWALIWLLFVVRNCGYAGFWSVARLLESEL